MSKTSIDELYRQGELLDRPTVRESPLASSLPDGRIRCEVCARRCILPPGRAGFCKDRINVNGKLYTVVYGDISSLAANPIEKKPFFHFWPGSYALTVGTWSCNLVCVWCQNYDISKVAPDPRAARCIAPETLVKMARAERCQGLSISFNEPTMLFEYALDLFPLARRSGLYANFVSNGYMTEEALRRLKEAGMDAIKFDLKGDREAVRRYCAAEVDVVWRNIRLAKDLGLHVEVVTLVIPGVNDDEACLREIARRHAEEAGVNTPMHFTRFYPAYRMTDRPPTPVATIEAACRIARAEGIRYVYGGNIPGHPLENTYCPRCGKLLVQRYGFTVVDYALSSEKTCPRCGEATPIVGEYVPSRLAWATGW